jgi:putative tributyrin esterase
MSLMRCDWMSEALRMETSALVALPEDRPLADAPVVYLLHGLTDNCTGWQRYSQAELFARQYGAALVMPEVQRSFYTDMASGPKYFTYIHDELPEMCQRFFRLENRPEHTYVMGLSMGGYGAMKCAFTTPERYAGCAAFSSVADIRSVLGADTLRMNDNREIEAMFGPDGIPPEDDLFILAERCAERGTMPRLFMACGGQDMLYEVNCRLRDALQEKKWPLEWRTWSGVHSWDFWNEALKQALAYYLG